MTVPNPYVRRWDPSTQETYYECQKERVAVGAGPFPTQPTLKPTRALYTRLSSTP